MMKLRIRSIASVKQGTCVIMLILIPFQKAVRLGRFSPGKNILKFDNGDGTYFE